MKNWSGRRDSNSRHSRWQRDALPLSYARLSKGKNLQIVICAADNTQQFMNCKPKVKKKSLVNPPLMVIYFKVTQALIKEYFKEKKCLQENLIYSIYLKN